MANCIFVSIDNKARYTFSRFYEFYHTMGIELGNCESIILTEEHQEKLNKLLDVANKELEHYQSLNSSYYTMYVDSYKYRVRALKFMIKNLLKKKKVECLVE